MQACTAIDWLQLYVILPTLKIEQKYGIYTIKDAGYQTRHFKKVYQIFHEKEEVAVLACHPHSNILCENGGLLKFNNKYLYQVDLKSFVDGFLKLFSFEFKSISRIDIALDFTRFTHNLNPEKFISGFFAKKYLKVGKSKGSAHFEQGKSIDFSYLSFGAKTSDVNYYLYNKTKQLNEVKMKPWIVDHWRSYGYSEDETVWRLEFKLQLSTNAIVNEDTGETYATNSLEILDSSQFNALHALLVNKYFQFVYNRKCSRKDRMKPVKLLSLCKSKGIKIKLSEKTESSRSAKIFAKQLMQLNSELRGHDFALSIFGTDLINYFILNRNLAPWAHKKLPDFKLNDRSLSLIPNATIK